MAYDKDKKELTALCMKCRDGNNKPTKQVMDKDSIGVTEKKNRYSAKGKCGSCSGNMFAFLSKDVADALVADGANITKEE